MPRPKVSYILTQPPTIGPFSEARVTDATPWPHVGVTGPCVWLQEEKEVLLALECHACAFAVAGKL